MSELEQTIEELEAEVLAELEEASDAQTKGAAPAEGKKKIDVVILHLANAVTRSGTCRAGSTFHLCVGDAEVAGPSVFVRQRKKAQHPSRFERHL